MNGLAVSLTGARRPSRSDGRQPRWWSLVAQRPGVLPLAAALTLFGLAIAVDGVNLRTYAAFTAATSNDNSTLSAASFSLTGTSSGSALHTLTNTVPGEFAVTQVTVTTVGKGTLTLNVNPGSAGVDAPLNGTGERALMMRVEQCASSFLPATCTGVASWSGAGVSAANGSDITSSNTLTYNATNAAGAISLQANQPSGPYYYRVILKIPSNTTLGDDTFSGKTISLSYVWTLASSAGSLRNTP